MKILFYMFVFPFVIMWIILCYSAQFIIYLVNKLSEYSANKSRYKKEQIYKQSFGSSDFEGRKYKSNTQSNKGKKIISNINEIVKIEGKTEKPEREKEVSNTTVNTNPYILPSLNILDMPKKNNTKTDEAVIEKNITIIEQVLKDFNIIGKVVEVHIGPAVTLYELEIKSGTKLTKIVSLNKEFALSLAKKSVRIEAPIPGKNTVGIGLPNESVSVISLREVIGVSKGEETKLLIPLGKDQTGNIKSINLEKIISILITGSTGTGKSVCIHSIICSILMNAKPDEIKFVLVDPKKIELTIYNGIPHLLCPVITEPKKASIALNRIIVEMERRYDLFEETRTKNIETYNDYVEKIKDNDVVQLTKMPHIIIIIDEIADLMMVAGKDVEASIMRITQMARIAGIHLIISTSKAVSNIVTNLMIENISTIISFQSVNRNQLKNKIALAGSERLKEQGEMLFKTAVDDNPIYVKGVYVDFLEIKRLIDYAIEQQKAEFDDRLMNLDLPVGEKSVSQIEDSGQFEEYIDPLYNEIVEFVIDTQKASASLLQRRFKLGYNRAARAIDLLEEHGIIGPANGSKPRKVLVSLEKEEI